LFLSVFRVEGRVVSASLGDERLLSSKQVVE
jgi:hypothetical protein